MTGSQIDLSKETTAPDGTSAATPQVVRLSKLYHDAIEAQYVEGKTLQQYLAENNLSVGAGEVVTVGGVQVDDLNQSLQPNDSVVVATANKNG